VVADEPMSVDETLARVRAAVHKMRAERDANSLAKGQPVDDAGREIVLPVIATKTHLTDDPFFVPAYDRAVESVEEWEAGTKNAPVRDSTRVDGESEFGWGPGRMPSPDKADPSQWDQMRSMYAFRNDPAIADVVDPYAGEYSE
jgi:hypothetical protein